MRAYEYRHTVGFEETNLVGNVYYVHHLRWQGRCREMFLRDHAPSVLEELGRGLALVTTNVSCEYLEELAAFEEITIRMTLGAIGQSRVTMNFEYWRGTSLVARGSQQIACMRREDGAMAPAALPAELRAALEEYQ
ncbi:MAG TPA: acyl-CoA thioesterase [Candidatus Sulfopaludibacter sp.]|nr:acyl-CoA thioesterase [Candidatus Sulfopaludibacter sp.]